MILAFLNQKGGSGKTTLANYVAAALVVLLPREFAVAVPPLSPQCQFRFYEVF